MLSTAGVHLGLRAQVPVGDGPVAGAAPLRPGEVAAEGGEEVGQCVGGLGRPRRLLLVLPQQPTHLRRIEQHSRAGEWDGVEGGVAAASDGGVCQALQKLLTLLLPFDHVEERTVAQLKELSVVLGLAVVCGKETKVRREGATDGWQLAQFNYRQCFDVLQGDEVSSLRKLRSENGVISTGSAAAADTGQRLVVVIDGSEQVILQLVDLLRQC